MMGGGGDLVGRAGGTVLGIGVSTALDRLADVARANRRDTGEDPLEVELVVDVAEVLQRLGSRRGDALILVIDPSWAAAAPDAARRLCLALALESRPLRVVLWGEPTPTAMHGVALCSRWISCHLVVRGVDDEQLRGLVHEELGTKEAARDHDVAASVLLERMPDWLRDAWGKAMRHSHQASVKGVAARLGLTRRSLERWHRKLGVPTPGHLVRMLK